jgi:tetratricopeptide (TPR) repeat protein
LGDINRLIGNSGEAAQEYADAITRFTGLAKDYPKEPEFRQALGYCHNWLGETIRQAVNSGVDSSASSPLLAEKEYTEAIRLQEQLHESDPGNPTYQQELARTYYNRGIVRFQMNLADGVRSDFSKAMGLLEPLVKAGRVTPQSSADPDPAQDLARVYNNYAIVVGHASQRAEAEAYYEKAIQLSEQLIRKNPENREYKAELAQYCDNESRMLTVIGNQSLAEIRSERALELVDELAAPSPSLSIKRAQYLQFRSQLLEAQKPNEAKALTDRAFEVLKQVDLSSTKSSQYSALYMNIGANYIEIAQEYLRLNKITDARETVAGLTDVMPHLSQEDRTALGPPYQRLQKELLEQRAHP